LLLPAELRRGGPSRLTGPARPGQHDRAPAARAAGALVHSVPERPGHPAHRASISALNCFSMMCRMSFSDAVRWLSVSLQSHGRMVNFRTVSPRATDLFPLSTAF